MGISGVIVDMVQEITEAVSEFSKLDVDDDEGADEVSRSKFSQWELWARRVQYGSHLKVILCSIAIQLKFFVCAKKQKKERNYDQNRSFPKLHCQINFLTNKFLEATHQTLFPYSLRIPSIWMAFYPLIIFFRVQKMDHRVVPRLLLQRRILLCLISISPPYCWWSRSPCLGIFYCCFQPPVYLFIYFVIVSVN